MSVSWWDECKPNVCSRMWISQEAHLPEHDYCIWQIYVLSWQINSLKILNWKISSGKKGKYLTAFGLAPNSLADWGEKQRKALSFNKELLMTPIPHRKLNFWKLRHTAAVTPIAMYNGSYDFFEKCIHNGFISYLTKYEYKTYNYIIGIKNIV